MAAFMVAVGTLLSSFWILVRQQLDADARGLRIVDGRFMPVDWLAVLFNPSFPYRLSTRSSPST